MIKLKNSADAYGIIAKCFHWLIAIAIVCLLILGFVMTDLESSPDKFRLYGIHKSIGALLLCAVFLRIFWRLINITPAMADLPEWQKIAAHGAHYMLYVLMIAMPLSGWLMSSAAGFPVSVFGWFVLPDLVAPNNGLRLLLAQVHELLAYAIIALVSLHALAALKHHFIDKDNTLRRMLPLLLLMFTPALLHAAERPVMQWYVVPAESKITFTATQNNSPIKGSFEKYTLSIIFSPDSLESSVIDGQIFITSLKMDYSDAVKTALSPQWFEAEKFQTTYFKTTSISHLGKNNYVAEAKLSLRGVTLPVILHFTLEEYTDKKAHIKGETSLSRKAFGIGKGEWAATDIIKDEVVVTFDIVASDSRTLDLPKDATKASKPNANNTPPSPQPSSSW